MAGLSVKKQCFRRGGKMLPLAKVVNKLARGLTDFFEVAG
jgi:hypothetical protein